MGFGILVDGRLVGLVDGVNGLVGRIRGVKVDLREWKGEKGSTIFL